MASDATILCVCVASSGVVESVKYQMQIFTNWPETSLRQTPTVAHKGRRKAVCLMLMTLHTAPAIWQITTTMVEESTNGGDQTKDISMTNMQI